MWSRSSKGGHMKPVQKIKHIAVYVRSLQHFIGLPASAESLC